MPKGTRSGGAGARDKGPDKRILEVAARRLTDHGFEGVEPTGGFSEWELFEALMRRDEAAFLELVARAGNGGASAAGRLMAVIEGCVVEYDWTFWIELWSLALRDERARALRRELDRDFRDVLRDLIADGERTGEFTVADREAATMAIAALIDSMAVQATLRDTTISPNYMFRACATVAGRLLGTELALPGKDGRS
jgi:hypothetical protein